MNPLANAIKLILSNPYTTLIGLVAVGALVVYSKTMTIPQVLNFVLTAAVAIMAKDAHNTGDSQ